MTSGRNVTVYEDKQTKVQTSEELVRNQFALDAFFCRNPTILHTNGNHLCRRSCSLLETSWRKMRVVPGFVNQNAKALGQRLDATTTLHGSDVSAASRPVTRSHCIFYLHMFTYRRRSSHQGGSTSPGPFTALCASDAEKPIENFKGVRKLVSNKVTKQTTKFHPCF